MKQENKAFKVNINTAISNKARRGLVKAGKKQNVQLRRHVVRTAVIGSVVAVAAIWNPVVVANLICLAFICLVMGIIAYTKNSDKVNTPAVRKKQKQGRDGFGRFA